MPLQRGDVNQLNWAMHDIQAQQALATVNSTVMHAHVAPCEEALSHS